MNKKLLALLLAILMVAMSAVAMADTAATATLTDLTKVFTTNFSTNNGIDRLPAETLDFTAAAISLTLPDGTTGDLDGAPQLTGSIAPSDLNNTTDAPNAYTGTFSISTTAAWPSAGIYTYKAVETASNIQGVTYSTDEILFEVLVSYVQETKDGVTSQVLKATNIGLKKVGETKTKNGTFTNAYNSGKVTITKTVTGNAGDMNDEFEVTLTFAPAKDHSFSTNFDTVTVGSEVKALTNNQLVVKVKQGSPVEITDIPEGTLVTAVETDKKVNQPGADRSNSLYDATYAVGETATNVASATAAGSTIAITNNRTSSIDTGVTTDSMPYILLMAFVAILAVAFVAKKRSVKE